MKKYIVLSGIILVVFSLVNARPLPQLDDGQELLAGEDTHYYRYPPFWFGIPFYDGNDDDFAANGGYNQQLSRSSTISYAIVGSGWGR